MPSFEVLGEAAWVELYSGWATTQKGGFLYGRVHKGKPSPLPEAGDGLAAKLHETFEDLDGHALANAQVRLSGFSGSGFFTADGHGFLKVPLPAGMHPGTVDVTVQLEMPNYAAASQTTKLQVWGATDPPLGVISDIDDTLTDTDVTHKLELLKNTFFHDTYDVKIFANAPQAVTAISGKGASLLPTLPVFYLSGSPWPFSLKLGIQVSPRTVRKYWPDEPNDRGRRRASTQHWATFVRNHADAMVACDFMVAVTAKFQLLYVFVMLELGLRRILQCNVTAHPTAEWTLQQFREGLSDGRSYRFAIHDRDSIISGELDQELVEGFGLRVLRTPPQSPKANAFCERLVGTIRPECLDFMIPLNERHLRKQLREWVRHYNSGRPHRSLGPGIPDEGRRSAIPYGRHRHPFRRTSEVTARPVLGGLHHEYAWQKLAA
jgi:Integrase core domain